MPKQRKDLFGGQVYAVEYSTGLVKIGVSCNADRRIEQLQSQARIYGNTDIVRRHVSPRCTNCGDLETELHSRFQDKRIRGELFEITFEEAVEAVDSLEFRDDSVALAEKGRAGFETLKGLVVNFWESRSEQFDPDDWHTWPDADVIERMSPLIRAQYIYAIALTNRVIETQESGMSASDKSELAFTIGKTVRELTMRFIGPRFTIDVVDDLTQGRIIDITLPLPDRPNGILSPA